MINGVSSTFPGNHIYQQGDPTLIIPFNFVIDAECLQDEWYNWVDYTFQVTKDNIPIPGNSWFAYTDNFEVDIPDTANMVEEATYNILLVGNIQNTYNYYYSL